MISAEGELLLPEFIGTSPDGLRSNGETDYRTSDVVSLRLGYICVFSQTREFENPVQEDLQDSIDKNGLLNPIDVVRIDKAMLTEYADFVLRVWGKEIDINSMPESTYESGMYDVVAAGHSRLRAMKALETKKAKLALDEGYMYDPNLASVPANIHHIENIYDILVIQIDENIHSSLAPERTAMALVEAYYLGRENGLWNSRAEFQQRNSHRFNKNQLDNACAFVRLPESVLELVFAKIIPYSVGVGLGKLSTTMYQYYAHRYFENRKSDALNRDERLDLDDVVSTRLMSLAAEVMTSNLNGTKAKKLIDNEKKRMLDEISGNEAQPMLDELFLQTAISDLHSEVRRDKAEIHRLVERMLGEMPVKMFRGLNLIGKVVDIDPTILTRFIVGTERITKIARESVQR